MISSLLSMLVINISLMVSFIYILNRIKPFSLKSHSAISVKVYYSIGFVILSVLSMNFNYNDHGAMIDFIYIPIMVAGFFGGTITGVVTSLLVAIVRLNMQPATGAINSALSAVLIGVISGLFTNYQYRKNIYLLIPALPGTFVILISHLILNFNRRMNVTVKFHVLLGILYPLAFVFMVLMFNDLIKINKQRKLLEQEATMDGMTGLYNFRFFDNSLKQILASAVKRSKMLSVAIIDIDYFKKINDTFGHLAGDEVLRQLGQVIRHSLRPFDIAARYGGEEFAAILPDCDAVNAIVVGERIRCNIENKVFNFEGHKLKITVSVGVTTFPEYAQNDDELIKQSDKALYSAKTTGRNKVVSYCELNNCSC